jgi:hypothetical protein
MIRMFILVSIVAILPSGAYAADTFLDPDEMALLKPDASVPGLSNYTTPGKDVTAYPKVVMGSITFFFAKDSKAKGIDAKETTQITTTLSGAMKTQLQKHFEVVDKPGPDTLLLNMGVTEIQMKNKKRGLLGWTPIGLVATTAGNLSGMRITLAGASLQGEVVDSVSGDIISLFQVDHVKHMDGKKKLSWDDVSLTLSDFAERSLGERFQN